MDADRHARWHYFMKTPTSTLIEYLSTKAKIMSKTRAPSAYMMREAAERMRDMFDMLKRGSSEESVEAELLKSVEPAQQ